MFSDWLLVKQTGSGFKSTQPFRSGYFGASIKLQPGYTAGVITSFYVRHSKITFHRDNGTFELLVQGHFFKKFCSLFVLFFFFPMSSLNWDWFASCFFIEKAIIFSYAYEKWVVQNWSFMPINCHLWQRYSLYLRRGTFMRFIILVMSSIPESFRSSIGKKKMSIKYFGPLI